MSNVTNSHNPLIVFSFLMLIWVSDSAAYVFGVNFGKRPLFKSVSPKKSVEGFLGGIIFSIILHSHILCRKFDKTLTKNRDFG